MEYATTWREKATPSGRTYWHLEARVRKATPGSPKARTSGDSWQSGPLSILRLPNASVLLPSGLVNSVADLLTSALDFSGWPTPRANENDQGTQEEIVAAGSSWLGQNRGATLATLAQLAGWPSPNTPSGGRSTDVTKMDITGRTADGKKHTASLEHAVKFTLAGWPTTTKSDGDRGSDTFANREGNFTLTGAVRLAAGPPSPEAGPCGMTLAGWAAPTAEDGRRGDLPPRPQDTGVPLSQQAALCGSPALTTAENTGADGTAATSASATARKSTSGETLTPTRLDGWSTPTLQDAANNVGPSQWQRNTWPLNVQAEAAGLVPGETSTSSPASTEKRGALHPAHSRWLMGFPAVWDSCGATAMQSSRKSPRNSSQRSSKSKPPTSAL